MAFNEARRPDPATGEPDMAKIGAFLADHPETVPAVTAVITHPIPASYATLAYHGLHAFGFVAGDGDGAVRFGRYHLAPDATAAALDDADADARPPDYLRDELTDRLRRGPAVFHLDVQLAADGAPIDDPSALWPDDREVVRIGRLDITALAFDREQGGDILVFDPTRVPDGIRLTDDAILHARSGAYSVSVARRTHPQG
jgi:catalase